MGEYIEELKSGGELIVNEKDWYIRYYFPGPDLRYNGTWKYIYSREIDNYILAWKNNFANYLRIKSQLNIGGSFEKIGEMNMKIAIGNYSEGVSFYGWRMCIRKQEDIDKIIEDYNKVKEKAPIIQKMIKSL